MLFLCSYLLHATPALKNENDLCITKKKKKLDSSEILIKLEAVCSHKLLYAGNEEFEVYISIKIYKKIPAMTLVNDDGEKLG